MFSHGHNITITGGSFNDVRGSGDAAFKALQEASAPSAFHNSCARIDPPKCHPNTRVAVLEYLLGWIFGRNDPHALIFWLYGPAGAGKSAILQTIAEHCFERKVLLASFFFSRSDPTRNHFKTLVATIAYQIATVIPETKPYIESVIERDPFIFDKSIPTQVKSLIVGPLKDVADSAVSDGHSTWARLVLIDALDECEDPRMQNLILAALADALREKTLPLIFLIASRPEQRITITFNSHPLAGLWSSLLLDSSFSPDDDIRLFLKDSFLEIKATHPHRHFIPEAWPEKPDVKKLVEKSSGQFIYASVVIKYVSVPDDRPPYRLEVIMGLRPARREVPFAELDALYIHIMNSCHDPDAVLLILGPIISKVTRNVYMIAMLLDLEPGDVVTALAPLNSIINVNTQHDSGASSEITVTVLHESFGDFLDDISRSSQFYINIVAIKENILAICLRKLMRSHSIAIDNLPPQHLKWALASLAYLLGRSLENLPLTETVKNALMEFSLPYIWSSWSPAHVGRALMNVGPQRAAVVIYCLWSLQQLVNRSQTDCAGPEHIHFPKIYSFHVTSFEALLKLEITEYYKDAGLMSLVVLATMANSRDKENTMPEGFKRTETVQTLFRITKESMRLDNDTLALAHSTWGADILQVHYHYLFTGPTKSDEVCLDGLKYSQTALRILEFLCAHPPHPIPSHPFSRKRKNPKAISRGAQPHIKQRTFPRYCRKRREEKHRYGVALSLPDTEVSIIENGILHKVMPCRYGLTMLPGVLDRSSKAPALVNLIRTHGKKIAFLPNLTRQAIRAIHEYLNRPDEDEDIADLRNRLAAMVIQ